MMSEEEYFWEVDPRSRWKNHCIVAVDGEKYRVEMWNQKVKSGCYSVLVHRYDFDERTPYCESVIGSIEFGRADIETTTKFGRNEDGEWAYKSHSSVSRYQEIFIERPRNFAESFATDILATSENGPYFKYREHIKELLVSRSERLRIEGAKEHIENLPYES
jgi:hypothetical protein